MPDCIHCLFGILYWPFYPRKSIRKMPSLFLPPMISGSFLMNWIAAQGWRHSGIETDEDDYRDQVKDFDNLSLPPPLDSRKDRAMTPDCMIKTDWTKFRCSSYNEARYWFVFRRSTLCAWDIEKWNGTVIFDTKGVLDLAVIIQYPQYWGTKSREQRFSRLFGVSCPAG